MRNRCNPTSPKPNGPPASRAAPVNTNHAGQHPVTVRHRTHLAQREIQIILPFIRNHKAKAILVRTDPAADQVHLRGQTIGIATVPDQLAAITAPIVHGYAGPRGYPTVATSAVLLMAQSGDTEGAMSYAEQVGTEGFFLYGRFWRKMRCRLTSDKTLADRLLEV